MIEGASVRLPFDVQGGPVPDIYLSLNGTNISLPNFTLFGARTSDAGEYRLIASNYLGAATNVARLTVRRDARAGRKEP